MLGHILCVLKYCGLQGGSQIILGRFLHWKDFGIVMLGPLSNRSSLYYDLHLRQWLRVGVLHGFSGTCRFITTIQNFPLGIQLFEGEDLTMEEALTKYAEEA